MSRTVQVEQLRANRRAAATRPRAVERLMFEGVGTCDVYNVSVPFEDPGRPGRQIMAGRVEERDSEQSTVVFFTPGDDAVWRPVAGAVRLALQDPFAFLIRGERYVGGVEIAEPLPGDGSTELRYRTIILRCADLRAPVPVFRGPWGMKDLRFGELPDGRLVVVTRPQRGADGRGRIGVTIVESFDTLTIADIEAAPRLVGLFHPDEWGGVNQVDVLADGRLDVVGHIARFDDAGGRHYYPVQFEIDPVSLAWTTPRLLFERADLPAGDSKRADLWDVVFPGGRIQSADVMSVFCGVGDAETWRVDLDG